MLFTRSLCISLLFVESSRIDYVYTDEATESVLQPIEEAASPFFSYIQPINHPKSHKMKPLLTLLLCWGCLVLSAQTQPCQTPQHRSFDFWVGNWTVYHAEADTVVGYNEVKPILNSCVIEENWTSANGWQGKSFNTYQPADSSWHQTWVDQSGNTYYFTGRRSGNTMKMSGQSQQKGQTVQFRMQYRYSPDTGEVRQTWTSSTDGGENWKTVFDGIYRKD